jgi:formiminotetrahydrofolate cyclodeaminase
VIGSDDVPRASAALAGWTAALAEATGEPGGGAASAAMLSVAASLASMVAGYSDPQRFADAPASTPGWAGERAAIASRAAALRERALVIADDDAAASGAFAGAFALPSGSDEHHAAVRAAALDAARSSARLAAAALPLAGDLAWLREHGNPAVAADVSVAQGALLAALIGARANLTADLALHDATPEPPAAAPASAEHAEALTELRAAVAPLDAAIADLARTQLPASGHE